MLLLKKINHLSPAVRQAIKEKLWAAEHNIAWLRLVVVAINSFVFLFVMGPSAYPALAYSIIIASFLYTAFVITAEPYRKNDFLFSGYFTTTCDLLLISLWIFATGLYESPFYLLWFVSIVAVAYRYVLQETLAISLLYAASYAVILSLYEGPMDTVEVAIRFSYILLTGLIAGLLSGMTLENIRDKVSHQQSELELKILGENLEKKIQERTRELSEANVQLTDEIQRREKFELKQKELLEDLEISNSELESFAYIVSHDLKAPLRGISTLSDWIVKDLGNECNEEVREKISLLRQRVDRMRALIDGILKLSRAGRSDELKGWVDTHAVILEVSEMIGNERKINFVLKEPLPKIWYERTALFQVFENLLSNACKYCDKDATVIISANRMQNQTVFSVHDNGPGIPPEHHDRIFQVFQTAGKSENTESTGVGLAIVKRIIEKNGGKVWVESTPGNGSNFKFTIPAAPQPVISDLNLTGNEVESKQPQV